MGGTNGIIIGLGMDSSGAVNAIRSLEGSIGSIPQSMGSAAQQASDATAPLEKSLLNQHQAVHLLTEEMGIRLPRVVIGGISEMLPSIGMIGPALLAAFALGEIPKLLQGIHDLADGMEGFDEAAKKSFASAIAASDDAFTHFKTIKDGIKFENEVNRNIAALSVQADVLESTGGVARNYAEAIYEFMSGNVAAGAAHAALAHAQKLDMAELGKLEDQRTAQLNTRTVLEDKEHKDQARSTKEATEAAHRAAEARLLEGKHSLEEMTRENREALEQQARAKEEQARRDREDTEAQAKALKAVQEAMRQFPVLPANYFAPLVSGVKQLTAAEREALPTEIQISKVREELLRINLNMTRAEAQAIATRLAANPAIQTEISNLGRLKTAHEQLTASIRQELQMGSEYLGFMDSFTDAMEKQAQAVGKDMYGAVKGLSEGVAGLIGSRRAQAAVECIFEGAEGAKQVAMALDPYDPMHVQHALSAAQHFVAAIEYGKVAGTSSHRHSAGGGGGGGGGSSSSRDFGRGGGGGGSRDSGMPPQTLAPGAGGSGSRFGGTLHIMVVGEHQAGEWLAGTLNAAVNRGVNLTATSSQRGSPVGH